MRAPCAQAEAAVLSGAGRGDSGGRGRSPASGKGGTRFKPSSRAVRRPSRPLRWLRAAQHTALRPPALRPPASGAVSASAHRHTIQMLVPVQPVWGVRACVGVACVLLFGSRLARPMPHMLLSCPALLRAQMLACSSRRYAITFRHYAQSSRCEVLSDSSVSYAAATVVAEAQQ